MRGSIVKKGSNYYIVYRDPATKKQVWKAAGASKKRAERILTEIISQIHQGTYQELEEISFADFADKWLSDYAEARIKANTLRFYSDIIRLHLIPYFGCINLTSISAHMVEEFVAKQRRETNLSPTSIGYHLRVLKTILKRAVAWGYLIRNPAELIEKPRITRKEMDFLNKEELKRFLDNVDIRFYPLFLTAALTGMRRGELLALKWEDINWATGQICIRRSLVNGKFDEPKSKAANRNIIMPPILVKELKKHKLSCPPSELNLIFPNSRGKTMNGDNLYRYQFQPALRRAGLRHVSFHSLRHTFASLLINSCENLKFIQSQLGHSSAQLTLDRYGHLMPEVQHGAGERLEETLFGDSVRKVLEK